MRITTVTLAIALIVGCDARNTADNTVPAASSEARAPASAARTATPAPSAQPAQPALPATVPVKFQGRYAVDAAACADAAHESRLTIEETRISFHESSGQVTNVLQGPTEITVTAQLSGEGETREANYRFRLSDDGSTLTDVGNGGITRQRCV